MPVSVHRGESFFPPSRGTEFREGYCAVCVCVCVRVCTYINAYTRRYINVRVYVSVCTYIKHTYILNALLETDIRIPSL